MAVAKLLKTPARWYAEGVDRIRRAVDQAIDSDDFLDVALAERKHLLEIAYVKDSIKLMRRFVKGYEAKDGFSLKHVALIPQSQIDKVKKYAPQLRAETAHITRDEKTGEVREHFKIISPKSEGRRQALAEHTRQTNIPGRKAFVLHTGRPDSTAVKYIKSFEKIADKRGRIRKVPKINIEIEVTVKKQKLLERFFYFDPHIFTIHDAIKQTRQMLPRMPEGWYTFVSSVHGDIMGSITKSQILNQLQTYFLGYDKFGPSDKKDDRGFAQTFLGYRYISSRFEGMRRETKNRDSNLMKFKKFRESARAKARREALKELKGI